MIEREHCLYVEIKLLETFLGYFHFSAFVGVLLLLFVFAVLLMVFGWSAMP